ncbi:hypothetical protein EMILIAHAH_122 [Bacillus phage vB_BanH_Emiliahah]|nr:hypothetical protein EMILIAHAH_122 [Bacillus phage vB_BanH_Emiliahah]
MKKFQARQNLLAVSGLFSQGVLPPKEMGIIVENVLKQCKTVRTMEDHEAEKCVEMVCRLQSKNVLSYNEAEIAFGKILGTEED